MSRLKLKPLYRKLTTSLRTTGKGRKRKIMRRKKRKKKDLPKNQLWNANSNRIVVL
jgi:hypothetical protein